VIGSVLAVVVGAILAAFGNLKRKADGASDSSVPQLDLALVMSSLMLGVAVAAPVGLYARTACWFAPNGYCAPAVATPAVQTETRALEPSASNGVGLLAADSGICVEARGQKGKQLRDRLLGSALGDSLRFSVPDDARLERVVAALCE
jgi:hypothetical protein